MSVLYAAVAGRLSVVLGAAILSLTAACSPPYTIYRRASHVPAPLASQLVPLGEATHDLQIAASYQEVDQNLLPMEGDPALWMAQVQSEISYNAKIDGGLRLGLTSFLTAPQSAQATARGAVTMVGKPFAWGVGPTIGFEYFPPGSHFAVVGLASIVGASLPYARAQIKSDYRQYIEPDDCWWSCEPEIQYNDLPPPSESNHYGLDYYDIEAAGRSFRLMTRAQLVLAGTYKYFDILPALELHNGFSNIGFDNEPRDGSTLTARDLVFVAALGGRAKIGGAWIGLQGRAVIDYDAMDILPGIINGVPLQLGLTGSLGLNLGSTSDSEQSQSLSQD